MENSSHNLFPKEKSRREIIEQELERGRDIANKLLEVLVHISKSNNSKNNEEGVIVLPFAEDLVQEVLRSFTNTLLLLNTTINSSSHHDDFITSRDFSSLSPPSCYQKHHHHEDYLDEASKSLDAKRRIGRYKRKSTVPNWEKDSPILIEDGHAWRKYGQKKTSNSKFFRNYYRCTYKYEQVCPAMKQVQRIQEDPPLYRTTYFGHHNCKSIFNHEIILEPDDDSFSGSSTFLSFNNNSISTNEQHQFFSSPVFDSTKQEPMEEELFFHDDEPTIIPHNNQFPQLSDDNYFLLCDYDEELDFNSFYGNQ